jgi:hypothetical protein
MASPRQWRSPHLDGAVRHFHERHPTGPELLLIPRHLANKFSRPTWVIEARELVSATHVGHEAGGLVIHR